MPSWIIRVAEDWNDVRVFSDTVRAYADWILSKDETLVFGQYVTGEDCPLWLLCDDSTPEKLSKWHKKLWRVVAVLPTDGEMPTTGVCLHHSVWARSGKSHEWTHKHSFVVFELGLLNPDPRIVDFGVAGERPDSSFDGVCLDVLPSALRDIVEAQRAARTHKGDVNEDFSQVAAKVAETRKRLREEKRDYEKSRKSEIVALLRRVMGLESGVKKD